MRNPSLESHLNALGIVWQYHDSVPLSKFAIDKGQQNQARVNENAIDHELMRQYKDAKKRGDQFPAVVAYDDGEKYVAVDGNHRLAADNANNAKTVDLYEILADPEDRLLLTYTLNTMNGRPQSEDDRDRHAVNLLQRGVEKDVIAATLHIPRRRIDEAVILSDAQIRANRLGRKSAWAKIPNKTTKLEIARGFSDDSVFAKAVHVAAKYELGRDTARALRHSVEVGKSEQERLDILTSEERALEKAKKAAEGRRVNDRKNPRAMANAHMEYIIQHLQNNISEIWMNLTLEEKNEIRERIRLSMKTLRTVEEIVG